MKRDENGKYYTVPANMKFEEWHKICIDEAQEMAYNEFKKATQQLIVTEYARKINHGQQDKHIVGTNNYILYHQILKEVGTNDYK